MTSQPDRRRRHRPLRVLALAAALPMLAAGCGDDDPASNAAQSPTPTTVRTPPLETGLTSDTAAPVTPRVATYEPFGEGGDSAALTGTLVIDEGGCVVVVPHEEVTGRSVVLPIFPSPQVAVAGDGVDFRGTTYRDGDPIDLGGGSIDTVELIPELAPDVPAACRGIDSNFMVSQE